MSRRFSVLLASLSLSPASAAGAQGAAATETLVLDAAEKVLDRGRIDESHEDAAAVREPDLHALDAALAGKPVPVPTAKAFGCSIKRV